MTEQAVLLERHAEGVSIVRLNRPEARNALNQEVRSRLTEIFRELSADSAVRCVVLTGGERVFAAGADLVDLAGQDAVSMMLRQSHLMWRTISQCPQPIVAAVNGFAWGGGCELAMHADIIVAGSGASFCQPEIKVGIMPGAGGTQRLVRAVGKFKAMKMVLTGEPVDAAEALRMGLCSEVVADEDVLDRALTIARTIARFSPLAVGQIKETLLAGQDASLETGLSLERKAFQLLFATEDQTEGMRAFLEKRQPDFKGR